MRKKKSLYAVYEKHRNGSQRLIWNLSHVVTKGNCSKTPTLILPSPKKEYPCTKENNTEQQGRF